jgi:hypothetical protein
MLMCNEQWEVLAVTEGQFEPYYGIGSIGSSYLQETPSSWRGADLEHAP